MVSSTWIGIIQPYNKRSLMQSSTSRNASLSRGLSISSIKSKPSPISNTRKRHRPPEEMDELDLMICHEEFTSLVALVEKVKFVQGLVQRASPAITEFYEQHKPSVPKSCLSAEEVLAVVERMREQLSRTDVTVRRGLYPVTDATMDDNFSILQKELEFCESCLRNHDRHLYQANIIATPQASKSHMATSPMTPSSTTKYSKWQSDILLQWLVENHKDPTMSRLEVKELAHRTGLSPSQVSTWLQNMKRRRKKNTIDGTKKATHFLDFLFLANERDENDGKLPSSVDMGYETPSAKGRGDYPSYDFIPYTPTVADHAPCTSFDDDNFSLAPEYLFGCLGTVTESFESLEPCHLESELDQDLLSVFASTWHDTPDRIATPPTVDPEKVLSSQEILHNHPTVEKCKYQAESRDDLEGMEWDDLDISNDCLFRKDLATAMVEGDDLENYVKQEN